MSATRVLYVAGTGRSGSTVLGNVLGQADGCVSAGELRFLWERGLTENRLCGCGARFRDCPFWARVLQIAFAGDVPDPEEMRRLQQKVGRIRALPRLWASRRHPQRVTSGLGRLPEDLARLYAAVVEVSGARVVVDSSKLPSYAVLLDSTPGIDVTVVHLVRDPRAAAFSWRRRKVQPDKTRPGYMERRGVLKSVVLWVVWNAVTELFWHGRASRYLRITYEEFIADGSGAVAPALARVGVSTDVSDVFVDRSTVRLETSHTVAGNPARLRHGDIRLSLDDEWLRVMPARDRALATVGAAPLLPRYGYPFFPRQRRPSLG